MPRPKVGRSRTEAAVISERRAKLVEMRRKKIPYAQIVEELDYTSEQAARKDFTRALEQSIARQDASVEVYREEQLHELEYLAEEVHRIFRTDHFHVSASGRIAEHPETGELLVDDAPKLAAADRLLKIAAQVAKLRGLDSPTRVEGVFSIDALNQAIVEAEQRLAALGDEAGEAEDPEEPSS